jgi:hypothetical protein
MAYQQSALQGQRQMLYQPTGAHLTILLVS